jgi:hypothetical protein
MFVDEALDDPELKRVVDSVAGVLFRFFFFFFFLFVF